MQLKPHDYQKEVVKLLADQKRMYFAMDMGTGKTITSLLAASELSKKNVLVIAEKNELENNKNFQKEVEMFFPKFTYRSLRKEEAPKPNEKGFVCAANAEMLHKIDIADLFDFVIVDEATLAKTVTTKRFEKVQNACDKAEYVVLLSGTPMMNGAAEIFAPLSLLHHPLANGHNAQKKFETVFADGREVTPPYARFPGQKIWLAKGTENVRELRFLLKDYFYFLDKKSTGIFRDKKHFQRTVKMSNEWKYELDTAWEKYYEEASKGRTDHKKNVLKNLKSIIEKGQMYQINSQWKVRKFVSDVKKGLFGDKRIVAFTMFIESDNLLQNLLEMHEISYDTFENVESWKTSDKKVLCGRINSHSKGTNVPEANMVVFIDMSYVPFVNIQCENRIDRPEQKNDMEILYYQAEGDEIDQHVKNINDRKKKEIAEFMRPVDSFEEFDIEESLEAMPKRYGAMCPDYIVEKYGKLDT